MATLGLVQENGVWKGTTDQNKLLMAPVQDSIVGETLEAVMEGSRSLLPIPDAYAPLLSQIPMLSMLGRLTSDTLIEMPLPCVLRSDVDDLEDTDHIDGAAVQDGYELATILAAAGPLLVDIDVFTEPMTGRRHRHTELTMKEVREKFPRSRCLLVDRLQDYDANDLDFRIPSKWRQQEKYNRIEWVVVRANPVALAKRLSPRRSQPRRRKPRPPAIPVRLDVSDVAGWVCSLRNQTSDWFLQDLQSHHTRDLEACWRTMLRLIPVIERIHGKYAYRRISDYRNSYSKMMSLVMQNPTGCIRKMYHIYEDFAYWLEQETLSKEAKQIQRGAFLTKNGQHEKSRTSSINNLPEDYRLERLPRCMRKPKPVPKGTTDESNESAEAGCQEKETVPA